ncbi:hypothetical protein AUJ17_00710 [Candidatus Micrarchaeota archaeon CG1_02_47_40]|nr:MAG: hypothetical protein AUJ17_00710 [Candidatus Micrarchaeota archaeon CG1_02_47_40]
MAFFDLFLGALAVFFATSIGSAGVFFFCRRGLMRGSYPTLLAICAGIMLYTSGEMLLGSFGEAGLLGASMSFLLGLACLFFVEKWLPHLHFAIRKKKLDDSGKKTALIAGTIAIHNIPEGFAVASAFAHSTPLGWLITATMAAQDAPEGLLVSTPLACYGVGKYKAFFLGVFSGFIEGAAAIAGFLFLSFVSFLTPFALGFSAGAMFYVVFAELLPDSFRDGKIKAIMFLAFGAIAGFALATFFRI